MRFVSAATAGWQPVASTFHTDIPVPTGQLSSGYEQQRRRRPKAHPRYGKRERESSAVARCSASTARSLSYSTLALEPPRPAATPRTAGQQESPAFTSRRSLTTLNSRREDVSALSATTAAAAAASGASADQSEIQPGAGRPGPDTTDLAALLSVLGLMESDVLPEMSKKSRALLGLDEGAGGEPCRGVEATRHHRSSSSSFRRSAPWVMLDKVVGMTPAEVAEVVRSYPLLLTVAAEQARSVVRWLADRVGLSQKQQMKRVLKSHPGVLRYEVETRLEPHAMWLEEEGLTKAGIGKIISKLPQARLKGEDFLHLARAIESNLGPKTAWLQEYLGLSKEGVASVLKSFPAVLALNVENLEGKAKWLEKRLGADRSAVSKVLKLNPSLFGSNIENSLEPKLEWLREGLGLEEADIAAVVRACPNVLRC
ncbi:unnamed protein product, partial [Hapterophycus canaliculatus]